MTQTSTTVNSVILDPTRAAFGPRTRVSDLGRTHFIGIGGAGMSVLAEMLHGLGVEVTGSDRESSSKTKRLSELGITVFTGQDARHVAGADTVVYSSAIKEDNPEIVAAASQGISVVHRSDILALLMSSKRAVTVAGAHGKTTTSSLLAHILRVAGTGRLADPSYAIGGSIQGPGGTVLDGGHAGEGDVLVAEADESDGSFMKYHPQIAVITNAEADHLDHYGTCENYRHAFVRHAGNSTLRTVICVDDPSAMMVLNSLDEGIAARCIAYSTQEKDPSSAHDAGFVSIEQEGENAQSGEEHFTIHMPAGLGFGDRDLSLPVRLRIPGLHNARNATAAIIAASVLGVDPHAAVDAASSFLGAERRFQVRGCEKKVTVVDDYAHHPTEIAALLDAARRRYPDSTIRVLFQPHLFSRTRFFAREFAEALAKADDVIVTGVFPAREKSQDFPGVGAQTIVEAARGLAHDPKDGWIRAVEHMQVAAQMMVMRAHAGDVIFTVGAGDITQMDEVLLHALRAHREACEA